MAVTNENDGVLAAAAVAAAAGVAAYGLRKALASGGGGRASGGNHDDNEENEGAQRGSLLPAVWESASSTLLPVAEDAAEAAGKWVAENSPDTVRDRIVPRFIEAFTDAA